MYYRVRQRQGSVEFKFANFKVDTVTAGGSYRWTVDLSINRPISNNTYIVKTVFQNMTGDSLFSGDDINLPAGDAGKTYTLTRSFQRDSNVSRMTFHIFNQIENALVVSQEYPLKKFTINNNGSFRVNIDEISARARFMVGMDQGIEVFCNSRQIQPAQAVACSLKESHTICPTLSSIDIDAVLNGNSYRKELKFDTPIKKIERYGLELTKMREDTIIGNGTGKAEVTITGSYIRPGSCLRINALASVDSDRFPVVFDACQQEERIYGMILVIGTDYLKVPDKFCFDITEITTCDDLYCGGTCLFLYRNDFNNKEYFGMFPYGNNFLNERSCR